MLRRAGPIMVLTLKWLLVPLALWVLGRYVIGPRIGLDTTAAQEPKKQIDATAHQNDEPDTRVADRRFPEPKVTVQVRKGATFTTSSIDRPKKHHKKKKPKPKADGTTPAPESAGGGGPGDTIPITSGGGGGTTGAG